MAWRHGVTAAAAFVAVAVAMMSMAGCGGGESPTSGTQVSEEEGTGGEVGVKQDVGGKTLAWSPPGFRLVRSWRGVEVYVRDYGNRRGYVPDYVTVVDLNVASAQQVTGRVQGAEVYKKTIGEFWQDASPKPAVMTNGTFFDPNRNPTPIPFGLKVDGRTISPGSRIGREYVGQVKLLMFTTDRWPRMALYDRRHFDGPGLANIAGGLAADANKSATSSVARTFAGLPGGKRIMFFASAQATQALAENALREFGCYDTIMLDGGGSTGLVVDGQRLIASSRPIPHVFAIYPGAGGGASGSW